MSRRHLLGSLVAAAGFLLTAAPAQAWRVVLPAPPASFEDSDCDAWDDKVRQMQSDVEQRHQACLDSQACKVHRGRTDSPGECSCNACESLHEEMTSYSQGDVGRAWKSQLQACHASARDHQRRAEESRQRQAAEQQDYQRRLDAMRQAQAAQNSAIQARNNQIYNNAMANQRAMQQNMANLNRQFAQLQQALSGGNATPSSPAAPVRPPKMDLDDDDAVQQKPSDFSVTAPSAPNLLDDEIAKIQEDIMTCGVPDSGPAYLRPGLTITYSTSCSGTSTSIEFRVENTGTGDAAIQFNWEGQSEAQRPSQAYGGSLGVGRLNAGKSTRLYGSVLNQDLPVTIRVFNVKYCDIESATVGVAPGAYVSPCARVPGNGGASFPIRKGSSG